MRQKEQNKAGQRRSPISYSEIQKMKWEFKTGQIKEKPKELIEYEKRVSEQKIQDEKYRREKFRKIWANVKLVPGQCYWHFKDNWHCLIVGIEGKEENFDFPYVHVWVFDNGKFSEQKHPEAVLRKRIFQVCSQYNVENNEEKEE